MRVGEGEAQENCFLRFVAETKISLLLPSGAHIYGLANRTNQGILVQRLGAPSPLDFFQSRERFCGEQALSSLWTSSHPPDATGRIPRGAVRRRGTKVLRPSDRLRVLADCQPWLHSSSWARAPLSSEMPRCSYSCHVRSRAAVSPEEVPASQQGSRTTGMRAGRQC